MWVKVLLCGGLFVAIFSWISIMVNLFIRIKKSLKENQK